MGRVKQPSLAVLAALVHARQHGGKVALAGTYGKGAHEAVKAGYAEKVGACAELNLRGQDIADEAIQLAARITA